MDTLDNANTTTNPFANSNNPDILAQKEGFVLNLADGFKQNGTEKSPTSDFLGRPTNGKRSADEFDDDDDLGPETDVDAVDDVLLSPAIAAAKSLAEGIVNNNPMNMFNPFCDDKEEKATLETDTELQKQQTSEFDPIKSPREETPTPPADSVHEASGLVDNVAESGEDSDDEWNYFKGDTAQKENIPPSQTDKEVCELTKSDLDDTMSQLNPNATEFVPMSPKRNTASPYQTLIDDSVIAQSPRRTTSNDIDISVPNPQEFESEIKSRPSDVRECANGDDDDNNQKLTSQEIMENLLNGKSIDEIEFQPNSTPTKVHKADEFHFGPNATPFSTPAKLLDQSEALSTKAVFGDESTASYLEGKGFDDSCFAGSDINESQTFVKEQDPMSMSFYQDKDDETNPFDLNKVQVLPDNIDDFLEKPNESGQLLNDTISDLPEHNPSEFETISNEFNETCDLIIKEAAETIERGTVPPLGDDALHVTNTLPSSQSPLPVSQSPLPVSHSPIPPKSPISGVQSPQTPLSPAQSPLPMAQSPIPPSQSPLPPSQSPLPGAKSPFCDITSPPRSASQSPFPTMECPCPGSASPVPSPLPTADSPLPTSQSPLPQPQSPHFLSQSPLPPSKSPLPQTQSPIPPAECILPSSQSPLPASPSPISPTQSPLPTSQSPLPPQSPLELAHSPVGMPEPALQSPVPPQSPLHELESPVEDVTSSVKDSPVLAASPIDNKIIEELKEPEIPIDDLIQDQPDSCAFTFGQDISNFVQETKETVYNLLDAGSEDIVIPEACPVSTPKSVDTESVATADVNSFLERSSIPEVTSPMSPSGSENKLIDAFTADLETNKIEAVQEILAPIVAAPQEQFGNVDLDIKSEIIAPEYPVQTITTPSEESKTEDIVLNEPVVQENKENVAEVVAVAAAATAIGAAAVATTQKKTPTAKPKAGTTTAAKKTPSKPATSPTKTTAAKPTAAKPPVTKTTTTATSRISQTKTSTAPAAPKAAAAKPSPKPKTSLTATKSAEKKPLTNGDIKPAVPKRAPITAASKTTTTKSVPSKLSPIKTESKTTTSAARPATAPAKSTTVRQTTTRPTTLVKTSTSSTARTTLSSSTVTATKSTLVKTTTVTSPKAPTSAAPKPRPATAPARSKPPTTRPAPKAADTEKQIKETANKQITASRTTTSRTTGSAGRTMTTVRKTEVKAPGTRTTLTKTTTSTLKATDVKKPAELVRHASSKTTKISVTKKTKPELNGIAPEVNTITISPTNIEPQLVKDVSPVIETLVFDNSQITEINNVTD